MDEKEGRSVTITISRRRAFDVKANKVMKKTKNRDSIHKTVRKHSEASLSKYSSSDSKPMPASMFEREEFTLPYRLYLKEQEKYHFNKKLGVKIHEHYKIISTDLCNRLQVEEPPDECHAVTDIDPEFFKCVNGRSLPKFIAAYKSLKYLFNDQIRLRHEVGLRKDYILNITCKHRKEVETYDKSLQKYKEQVKSFEDFISYDYNQSKLSLSKWDAAKMKVLNKSHELKNLAAETFNNTSKLIGLDYKYGLQQKYGRFLYYLSPPSWRAKNRHFAQSIEIEAKGFDFGNSSDEDTFNVIFAKLKRQCSEGLVKPVLYFTHPNDLMKIFEDIEQQQLHNFTHVAQIAPITKSLKSGINHLKAEISQDSAWVSNTIKDFETRLAFFEEHSAQLEAKFFRIINGLFFDVIGAPNVLKLHEHLQYCYERVFNETQINMNSMMMAKAIEDLYMEYCKTLDAVTSTKINQALKKCMQLDFQKVQKGKTAARELRLFERLEKRLLRAYEPVATRVSKIPYSQFTRKQKAKKVPSKVQLEVEVCDKQSLTDAEKEYLTLFTDWTEQEDPANYLQSLTLSDSELNELAQYNISQK